MKILMKLKKILMSAGLVFGTGSKFITTWRTTTANESVTLPANGTNDVTIDWGDGSTETVTTANPSHTYSTAGDYDISIDGTMTSWYQNNQGDKDKLIEIKNWGDNKWQSLQEAFYGCANMTCSATDILYTAQVTSMRAMFFHCNNFNGDVSSFDTSNVTDMQSMFQNCYLFNQSVDNFDTSKVTLMTAMFFGCYKFNQSVSNFDTSNVLMMKFMFTRCYVFNQSVSNFNTSKVQDIHDMFYGCSSFNQDLSNFDTSNVIDMREMFSHCDIFNQDISTFNISSLTNAESMLNGTAFNITNYDKLLIAWNNQTHNANVALGVGTTQYESGDPATARTDLVNDGWTITDGGQV